MSKTKNALNILRKRREKDAELQKYYEEEKAGLSAALAIYKAREEAGLTQEELARKIGTTQSVISRLEDADYEGHTFSMMQRIADALNRRLVIGLDKVELIKENKIVLLHSPLILKEAASFSGWGPGIDLGEEKKSA